MHRDFKDAQFYSCGPCSFDLNVECALMSTSGIEGRDWIRHFGHSHPLLLRAEDHKTKCFGCKSTSSGGDGHALYGCAKCDYFLHKSCAELPQNIHLPVHRIHRQGFDLRVRRSFQCEKCQLTYTEDSYNFRFACKGCNLWICFKCAEVTSGRDIEYEDHQHPLRLVENVKDTASLLSQCNGYDSYCTQHVVTSSVEFNKNVSLFWCFYCDFKVHLLCAPLPAAIVHEFHIHPLVLVDSLAEDDYGEYYCDVCETKRDPRIRLYYCQDCKYFAHIHCVIPEVVKVLQGERRDVELKTVGHDIWNVRGREFKIDHVDPSNLTLKDVLNDIPEDEKWLRNFYKWDEKSSQDQKEIEISNSFKVGDEEIDEILQLSHFTDESFERFWSNLQYYYSNIRNKVELKWSDLAMKIVKVNDYMIPHSLAAVLNTLLCEVGDIGSRSDKSLGMKSFVYFVVCKVAKEMHSTMPECITKNLMQEWYFHLNFANQRSFEVRFLGKKLAKLVHAFLGFQAKRLKHEIPTVLAEKIAELQRKLEECKEICGSSSKCEYKEYCFNMASEFKWKQNPLGDFAQKMSTQDSRWVDGVKSSTFQLFL